MLLRIFVGSLVALSVVTSVTAGKTIYVDDDATGDNNGTSWEDAYNHLWDALRASVATDEIRVAQGVYRPDRSSAAPEGSGDREASFVLASGVALLGGYAGLGGPEHDARDSDVYETILSGDLAGNDLIVADPYDQLGEPTRSENSYHVVTGHGVDNSAKIDGFTIAGGNANAEYTPSGNPLALGGGIYAEGGSPTITRCVFKHNSASDHGGGVYRRAYPREDPIRLESCTFLANYGDMGAGGAMCSGSASVVGHCRFIGNATRLYYGGLRFHGSDAYVVNCAFAGNSAKWGGGMGTSWGEWNNTLFVGNCTFVNNSVTASGGGLAVSSHATIANCIFWGNTAVSGSAQVSVGDVSSANFSYCDVQGGLSGIGVSSTGSITWGPRNTDRNPQFEDADGADDVVGTVDDDLRLTPGSPCVDAGSNSLVPVSANTDLDGNPRFADDPRTPDTGEGIAPIVDIGAIELLVPCGSEERPYPVGDLNGDCEVNFLDIAIILSNWLAKT